MPKKEGLRYVNSTCPWMDHTRHLFSSFGLPVFSVHAMINMHYSSKSIFLKLLLNWKIYTCEESFDHPAASRTQTRGPFSRSMSDKPTCLQTEIPTVSRNPPQASQSSKPIRGSVTTLRMSHAPAQPTTSMCFKWHGERQAAAQILSFVTENEPPTF